MNDLDPKAVALAPALSRFGLEATELDMLKRGDMLGSIGGKVFDALVHLSAVPDGEGELMERAARALAVNHWGSDKDWRMHLSDAKAALAASRLSQAGVRVPNDKWSDREPIYEAAIAAYEANTPKDYRYSALAMVKAVDAAIAALSGDTL